MAIDKGEHMSPSLKERWGSLAKEARRVPERAGRWLQGFADAKLLPIIERFRGNKDGIGVQRSAVETTPVTNTPVVAETLPKDAAAKENEKTELTIDGVLGESRDRILTIIRTDQGKAQDLNKGISDMELRIQRYALHPVSVDSNEESIITTDEKLKKAKEDLAGSVSGVETSVGYWRKLDRVETYLTVDLPELPKLQEEQKQLEKTVAKLDAEMRQYIIAPVSVGGESGRITDVEDRLRDSRSRLGTINARVASIMLTMPDEFRDGFDPEELKKPSHSEAEKVYKETVDKLLRMTKGEKFYKETAGGGSGTGTGGGTTEGGTTTGGKGEGKEAPKKETFGDVLARFAENAAKKPEDYPGGQSQRDRDLLRMLREDPASLGDFQKEAEDALVRRLAEIEFANRRNWVQEFGADDFYWMQQAKDGKLDHLKSRYAEEIKRLEDKAKKDQAEKEKEKGKGSTSSTEDEDKDKDKKLPLWKKIGNRLFGAAKSYLRSMTPQDPRNKEDWFAWILGAGTGGAAGIALESWPGVGLLFTAAKVGLVNGANLLIRRAYTANSARLQRVSAEMRAYEAVRQSKGDDFTDQEAYNNAKAELEGLEKKRINHPRASRFVMNFAAGATAGFTAVNIWKLIESVHSAPATAHATGEGTTTQPGMGEVQARGNNFHTEGPANDVGAGGPIYPHNAPGVEAAPVTPGTAPTTPGGLKPEVSMPKPELPATPSTAPGTVELPEVPAPEIPLDPSVWKVTIGPYPNSFWQSWNPGALAKGVEWVNPATGATNMDVVKQMAQIMAKGHGVDLSVVQPGQVIDLDKILTPVEKILIKAAANTTNAADYVNRVMPWFLAR